MQLLSVPREMAQQARLALSSLSLVDKGRRILVRGGRVLIPLCGVPPVEIVEAYGGFFVEEEPPSRDVQEPPIEMIRQTVEEALAGFPLDFLPDKWEKLGDVVCLRMPTGMPHEEDVARIYAAVLGATAVVDYGSIKGVHRTPTTRVIWASEGRTSSRASPEKQYLITTHTENGIRYRMDVLATMFSSGNIDERQRMAKIPCAGETIVDMFAGIGYFTLPMAVYGTPKRVVAYEINPIAHSFLVDNCSLNNVSEKVDAVNSDNRMCPERIADRVIMGYVGTTHKFLDKAMSILAEGGGWVHYHETCPNELLPDRPVARMKKAAGKAGFAIETVSLHRVKSYAPGVTHIVLDAKLSPAT